LLLSSLLPSSSPPLLLLLLLFFFLLLLLVLGFRLVMGSGSLLAQLTTPTLGQKRQKGTPGLPTPDWLVGIHEKRGG